MLLGLGCASRSPNNPWNSLHLVASGGPWGLLVAGRRRMLGEGRSEKSYQPQWPYKQGTFRIRKRGESRSGIAHWQERRENTRNYTATEQRKYLVMSRGKGLSRYVSHQRENLPDAEPGLTNIYATELPLSMDRIELKNGREPETFRLPQRRVTDFKFSNKGPATRLHYPRLKRVPRA
jgi:hypothetical protein